MKSETQKETLEEKAAYRVDWIESERDWGMRPDGISLHLSTQDAKDFVDAYWAGKPDEVPDVYSFPDGIKEAYVDAHTYARIRKSIHGIRVYDESYQVKNSKKTEHEVICVKARA
jgi:hypothetical protein